MPLQGLALPVETWERDVLPRRTGAYSQSWLDSLCASGEVVWVGAGASGRSGRVALYFREDAAAIGPPAARRRGAWWAPAPDSAEHELLRARLAQGPSLLHRPARRARCALQRRCARRCGIWCGLARSPTTPGRRCARHLARGVAPTAVRARSPVATRAAERRALARARASPCGGAAAHARARTRSRAAGRSTDAVFRGAPRGRPARPSAGARSPSCCSSATASSPASRCSPRASRAASRCSTTRSCNLETLGVCRRGYFIEGMGGAQFALPGAVERLRARSLRADRGRPGAGVARTHARARRRRPRPALRRRAAVAQARRPGPSRPARVAGAYVVLVADEPVLYVERGGRGLVTLADAHGAGAVAAEDRSDARGAGGARRGGPRRAGRQARARAHRRPAGDRLRASPRRSSSSDFTRSASAHAHRLRAPRPRAELERYATAVAEPRDRSNPQCPSYFRGWSESLCLSDV